jgi:hypothetical protein
MERMSQPKPRRKRPSKSNKPVEVTKLSEHELRDAAYFLWEQEGRPEGRALDHWLQVAGRRDDSMNAR